jgi:hypothetical protein
MHGGRGRHGRTRNLSTRYSNDRYECSRNADHSSIEESTWLLVLEAEDRSMVVRLKDVGRLEL